jgi:hypothetical protein
MIEHVRLGLDEDERGLMVSRLKEFLTEPHVYMDVVKNANDEENDLLAPDLWGNANLYDLEEDRSYFNIDETADVPLLPIFEDLMSLKCLEAFYHEVEQAIDRDEEERAEEEEEDSESEQDSDGSS